MASEARNAGRYIIYDRTVDDFMMKHGREISSYVISQSKERKKDLDSVRNLDELTQAVALDMIEKFPEMDEPQYKELIHDMARNIKFKAERA